MWTAILDDADQGYPYLKRFTFEPTAKPLRYLGDNPASRLLWLSDVEGARVEVTFGGDDSFRPAMEVVAREFVAVKSFRAKGKRLTTWTLGAITELDPLPDDALPDGDDAPAPEADTDDTPVEPEKSDEEVRDEIIGQQRLFE